MKQNVHQLFIVRHAEAIKNLERVHGGGTQDLTELGVIQAKNAAMALSSVIQNNNIKIYHQVEQRTTLTANIISNILGPIPEIAPNISGINLGIISELTESELKIKCPEAFTALQEWRSGASGLKKYPNIPGREHTKDFAKRISSGMLDILSCNNSTILVCTTSTINMINHLLLNNWNYDRSSYTFVNFPFAGINGWEIYKDRSPQKIFSSF